MAGVYTTSFLNIRDRCEFKLRDDRSTTQVDNWINDVIQAMTGEIYFDEMYKEGSAVKITGDGSAQIFDLPEDFQEFVWVRSDLQDRPLDEASPREIIEDWRATTTIPVQTPQAYAKLGRTGAAGVNLVPLIQVKFDTIPASAEIMYYAYYALHPRLTSDSNPILLPQTLLSTIVDGVLMESDSWNDSDQFAMHRDRFLDKMNQLKRNQNRRPNRRRGMGRSPRGDRGRPARVQFPSNYPDVHGSF